MLAPFQHQIDLKHDKPAGIHRRAFSWNGALRSGVLPGLSDRHEPDLESKGSASPPLGRSNRVGLPGAPRVLTGFGAPVVVSRAI